jgi:hypothetical protein
MANSLILMNDTSKIYNLTGQPFRADGFYGNTNSFYTIVLYFNNLQARIWIEASLASNPSDSDWFPINLNGEIPYREYPVIPNAPTSLILTGGSYGSGSGDTGVEAFNFKANISWIRARLDRTYMGPSPTDFLYEDEIAQLGNIKQIILSF